MHWSTIVCPRMHVVQGSSTQRSQKAGVAAKAAGGKADLAAAPATRRGKRARESAEEDAPAGEEAEGRAASKVCPPLPQGQWHGAPSECTSCDQE